MGVLVALFLSLMVPLCALADYGKVVVLSTQARPVEEAEKMRREVFRDFPGEVEFVPEEEGFFIDRVLAETRAGKGSVDLLLALHGTFPVLLEAGALRALDPLMGDLPLGEIPKAFLELGRLGTPSHYYLPVMQATYIFCANKEALVHLPSGARLEELTWDELRLWAKNIFEATGERKLAFPAGERGLIHRFIQGYLYPSFTGGMVRTFCSGEAQEMWKWFKGLWSYVNPQSLLYEFMQEPLLSEEVWVAFDHTARLVNAFKERPEDFVTIAAPIGPKGRGFMPVVVGAAIPRTAPNPEGAKALLAHLLREDVQLRILKHIGFFPVLRGDLGPDVPEGVRLQAEAVAKQAGCERAIPSLLPVGLGAKGGEFNKVFRDTFYRIVVRGEEVKGVLAEGASALERIFRETGAPCWPPDPPSDGPCPIHPCP